MVNGSGPSKIDTSLFVRQLPEVVVESLEGVPNEWQAHLRTLLHLANLLGSSLDLLGLEKRGVISLVNFVGGEVRGIDVAGQPGLEWSSDASQRVKLDTAEEGVALDLMGTTTAQTVLSVAHKAVQRLVCQILSGDVKGSLGCLTFGSDSPPQHPG